MATFVSNANVASNAAIAVTKLALGGANQVLFSNGSANSFTGAPILTSLTASSFLAIGSNLPDAGGLRIANNTSVVYRNQANDANLTALVINASNNVVVGNDTSGSVDLRAATNIRMFAGGTQAVQLGRSASDFIELGGTSPATAGHVRFNHNNSVQGRDNGSNNRIMLDWGSTTNQLNVGDGYNAHTSLRGGDVIVAAGTTPTTIATFSTSNILTTVGISTVADGGNARNLARYNSGYEFGDGTSSGTTNTIIQSGGAASTISLSPAGTARLVCDASLITYSLNTTSFHQTSAVNPTINQITDNTNGITGDTFTVQAQNATGTTTTGGALNLTSGTGTTVAGNVVIQTGGVAKFTVSPTTINTTVGITSASTIVITSGNLTFGSAGAAPVISQATTAAASATGLLLTLNSQDASGNTNTAGGALTIRAGNATGAGGTHVGGAATISAGSATGASGTRTGGALVLNSGTGATTDGEVTIRRGAATVFATNSSNITTISGTGGITLSNAVSCGSSLSVNAGGGNTGSFTGNGLSFAGTTAKTISAGSGSAAVGTACTISGFDTTGSSQTGGSLTVRGGNGNGSNNTGGDLILKSGAQSGTGLDGYVRVQVASAEWLFVGRTVGGMTQSAFWFSSNALDPEIRHLDAIEASDFRIQAQNAIGGGSVGGDLELVAGTGLSRDGSVELRSNGTQLKVSEFSAGQVAVGLFRDFDNTNIPGNADKVLYVGEVGSSPTATTPVGGFLMWCENGNVCFKTTTPGGVELPWTTTGSAGSHATYLRIIIGGVTYKIDLLNDA